MITFPIQLDINNISLETIVDFYSYNNNINIPRIAEIEQKILASQNPQIIYGYICNAINGRWLEAEEQILLDIDVAIDYAKKFFANERWNILEHIILRNEDPLEASEYAIKVLDGRWEEAESLISKDAEASYKYSKYALNDKFPLGEDAINSNEVISQKYNNTTFGTCTLFI